MKAVNLIPTDSRQNSPLRASSLPGAPTALLLGVLAIALASVTMYVLTSNTISQRKAQIAGVQAQLSAAQAQAAQYSNYKAFESLADARAQTVIQIAGSRFDWQAALADLSQVVPPNTSLQSLLGTVSPNSSVGAASGASTSGSASGLRDAIAAPAFELSGCTKSHDDVARLMSRLRLINGVTRVTLADDSKPQAATAASSGSTGCGSNAPSFDLVVFFQPIAGAAAVATTGSTGSQATTTPASTTTTAGSTTTTPGGATTTTPGGATTTTPATSTTPAGAAPASSSTGSGAGK